MSGAPKISVLLSTYNDERYIKDSVYSVLNQSFREFEFIIIDDGSTDGTYDIISNIKDPRVTIFRKENSGLIDSLNFGVTKCTGEYIARMDGDDICHIDRLKIQFELLSKNSEYSICGSNTIYIDEKGREFGRPKLPISDEEIKIYMMFGSPISHPSVMIKRDVMLNNPYSHDFPVAEDYELWSRLRYKCAFFNVEQPLLYYRFHGNNVSLERREIAKISRIKICETYFNNIFDDDILNGILYSFILCDVEVSADKYRDLIERLLLKDEFKSSVFRRYTAIWWFILALQKRSISMLLFNTLFRKYPLEYIKSISGYIDLFRLKIFLKKRGL